MLSNESQDWEGWVGKRPRVLQSANRGAKQEVDVDNEPDI